MTQQAEKEYTWKDLEAAVGRDFSGGVTRTGVPLDRGHIREFCEVLEMDCPLFHDPAIARRHGYTDIISPVSMLPGSAMRNPIWKPGEQTKWPVPERNAVWVGWPGGEGGIPLPKPKTTASAATDIDLEYLAPVVPGDVLTQRGQKLVSVAVRETRVGVGAFIVSESEIVNQRGELVMKGRNGGYRYNPHPTGARPLAAAEQAASKAWEAPPARAGYVDWDKQLFFEDVREGQTINPVAYNITVQRLVMEAYANRDFAPIHHNTEAAQGENAPEMYPNNVFLRAMWERTVREFIGLDGKIKKLGPYRMRIFNPVGNVVVVKGTVKRKWQEGGENLVELEVWSENSWVKDVSVGPGPAIVSLPSRPRR